MSVAIGSAQRGPSELARIFGVVESEENAELYVADDYSRLTMVLPTSDDARRVRATLFGGAGATIGDKAIEARARRAAKRAGLRATKSRWRLDSVDNYGGFMLVDDYTNTVVNGVRYDLSAEDVIEYCADSLGSAA